MELERTRYKEIFEFAPDGYLVTDPSGNIREANRAIVELLGVSRMGLLGKPIVLYVTPDERQRFHLYIDILAGERGAQAGEVEWEMQFKGRQGRQFPAGLTAAPIRNAEDELVGLHWLVRDLTATKRDVERERLLAQIQSQHREMKETNHLLHAFIETMPVGALMADADGTILLTNTAGKEILGSPVTGNITSPKGSFTVHLPDGTPLPPEEVPLSSALRKGNSITNFEMLVRREDGEERNVLVSAVPILDEAGKVISAISIFRDISEGKRARQALRRYADRLQGLRSADQVILSAGSLGQLVELVLPFTRQLVPCQLASVVIFDWQAHEVQAIGLYIKGHSRLLQKASISIGEGLPLEELSRGELNFTEDLSSLNLQPELINVLRQESIGFLLNVPLLSQGNLLGILNLGFEKPVTLSEEDLEIIRQMAGELAIGIQQIRQREELQHHAAQLEQQVVKRTGALRDSEERFRTILDAAIFGIALLDGEGRIVASNPALQNMTGYGEKELTGMTFSGYSHPEDAAHDQELYASLVSRQRENYQVERRFIRKDGQLRWSEFAVSRIKRATNNKRWLAVASMADITEKKRIQELLANTERLTMAGRLGASLAHEINNPLQSVIGCLGLAEEMLENEGNDGEVRRYLEIAMQELERTAEIVAQLRDMSREVPMRPKEPVDLNALVEKSLS